MNDKTLGGILALIGVFALAGAIFQWSFFMNHRKAQFFIRLFGVNGTRIIYGALGVGLSVFGCLMALGIIEK